MLDIKLLRSDPELVVKMLATRGFQFKIDEYNALEQQRRSLQTSIQQAQSERNRLSQEIGKIKARNGDVQEVRDKVNDINTQLKKQQQDFLELDDKLEALLNILPNLPHKNAPLGESEEDNQIVKNWGEIPEFDFTPQEHFALNCVQETMDFATAAKISGARFVVLRNNLAKLQRALGQFMLDTHVTQHGYQEVYVPYLVKTAAMRGTGQLPKFFDDQYAIAEQDLWLLPTAEVPVTNLVQDTILFAEQLPLKFVAQTPCFRKEAGAYGKDTKGMFRQHQFEKVELVQIVTPENSEQALQELTKHAENILQLLELPYRVMNLCTKDLGFAAAQTFDLEVWLPGQKSYREISSCSNYWDFQARRLKARYKNKHNNNKNYVHTINGSGVALGRALIAVLENYQDKEGNVNIPQVLRPYMGGVDIIQAEKICSK